MRVLSIVILISCFFSCVSSKNSFTNKKRKRFLMHLNILDSAAKNSIVDTVSCCSNSIAFMVDNTDVKVHSEATFHGFLFFTKGDLVEWHKFYEKKNKQ
jgi:hypothetical protein